jgi:hypothetical protein
MRRTLLFLFVIGLCLPLFAQQRAVVSKELRNRAVKHTPLVKGGETQNNPTIPGEQYKSILEETEIGTTFYDVQSNRGMQERIYLHSDGTLGAVWTRGPQDNPSGPNRGTGYNYFDGNAWGPDPEAAIESGAQAGWPSYVTWGENGEAYACHDYFEGTILGTRTERGTGDWELVIQAGPSGAEDISFPRITTTGPDRSVIHLLSTTWVEYNNQTTALLYARTSDGGTTWDVENELFDNLGPDFYTEVGGDVYDWADPKGDLLAFLVGDNWLDLVLMKSYDDGDTWDETKIWECPYPLYTAGITDTFYCPDGSHDIAIDNNGKVHIAFSLTRALGDEGGNQSYFPGVDGVVYWNEDMELFSNNINALNPYGHEDSELVEDYNLIGWTQDIDGNGSVDILEEWGYYNTGMSSQPQISIDDMNQVFVLYSSVTEGYDNGLSNYRHLWVRASPNGGEWWGKFLHLNEDLVYIFDECVFPSMSSTSDDNIHFTYQADSEPGTVTNATEVNKTRYMMISKADIISRIAEQKVLSDHSVSQNYPNPFTGTSTVYVNLDERTELSLEVSNLTGQVVYTLPARTYPAGKAELIIEAANLGTGVYFYTVRSGNNAVTKKMIVE